MIFEFIQKTFIPSYKQVSDKNVREKYGVVMSVFCIICNLILVIFKIGISFVANSLAIRADGLNNLSDMGSNLASLFGFKLSNKHADIEHPYGHGRIEYISGLVIGFLIMAMGIFSIFESINKISSKEELNFSYLTLIIVVFSILVKFMMGFVNKKAGVLIDSETLLAASKDSFNDVLLTSSTLISLLVYKIFNFNIDAYIGLIVSFVVIKSGYDISKDVVSLIIGKSPDKDLIKEIEDYVLSNKEILGIHDVMFHDYGPSSKFMTFHVEVDYRDDVVKIHDKVDNIENYILGKYGILTTIHTDPLVVDDPKLNEYKDLIRNIVKNINEDYDIHDFRMVKGPTHTNLVFDLVLPLSETRNHGEIRKELMHKIKEVDQSLNISVKIEHSYL